ncbi:MAG: hypothetical protein K8Q91_00440 [Candidatus Vogelbacteria bacterium]|nr:hypothetical protein [Candidatus Vogelbacteria bacterium]
MQTNQKGFLTPLIAVVVAVLVIGGGTSYYFKNRDQTSTVETLEKEILTKTNSQQDSITSWKTYTSEKDMFSFKYPPSWDLVDSGHGILLTNGEQRISINVRLRNMAYEYQNTLEKDIRSRIRGEFLSQEKADQKLFEKFIDTKEVLAYVSQWEITAMKDTFQTTRVDFEFKNEPIATNSISSFKKVISLTTEKDFNDTNLLKSITNTFTLSN